MKKKRIKESTGGDKERRGTANCKSRLKVKVNIFFKKVIIMYVFLKNFKIK